MIQVWRRVELRDGVASVGPRGAPVSEVIGRLEAGEPPPGVAGALGLEPADLIAALAFEGVGADGEEGPTLVRSSPRRPRLEPALSERAWAELLPGSGQPARLALAAGLLQVLDFWDASHEAAQLADDRGERAVAAYWHGIAHRREPDPGNASYWFRRVGRHPVYARLAREARPLLEAHGDAGLTGRLLGAGDDGWDPSLMIDLCSRRRDAGAIATLARKLQRLEMILLLEATCEAF